MKRIFLSIFTSLICAGPLCAHDWTPEEKQLWTVLESGDWSLGHKLLLTRQTTDTNDELLSQFMFMYLYYKNGQPEEAQRYLEFIDQHIQTLIAAPLKLASAESSQP